MLPVNFFCQQIFENKIETLKDYAMQYLSAVFIEV